MKAQPVLLGRVGSEFIKVQSTKGGLLQPVPDASKYYVRYSAAGKRKVAPAGSDFTTAVATLKRIELQIQSPEVAATAVIPNSQGTDTIADLSQKWFNSLETRDLAYGTLRHYKLALKYFQAALPSRTRLQDVTREDLEFFIRWLRKNENVPTKGKRDRNNTVRNYLQYLHTFFAYAGFESPYPREFWPKGTTKEITIFTDAEIQELIDAAEDETEKLTVEIFAYSGLRDGEVAHLEYADFNYADSTVSIGPKAHLGWKTKSLKHRKERINLPPAFVKRIRARQGNQPGRTLVFPSSKGTPNTNILRSVIRPVARRAGWSEDQVAEAVGLHKFRKTIASKWHERGIPLTTIQILLGHANVKTTTLYVKPHKTEQQIAVLQNPYGA